MKRFISLFASLLVCTFGAAWFSQDSINAYWQQTYHQASPLEPLSEYEWWRTGAQLQQKRLRFFRRPQSTFGRTAYACRTGASNRSKRRGV